MDVISKYYWTLYYWTLYSVRATMLGTGHWALGTGGEWWTIVSDTGLRIVVFTFGLVLYFGTVMVPKVDPDRSKPLPDNREAAQVGAACTDPKDDVCVVNRRNLTKKQLLAANLAAPIIEFDPAGNVMNSCGDPNAVPNGHNGQAHILDRATGQILDSFGRGGHPVGELTRCHTLAVDSKGNIIDVVETGNDARVQKFTFVGYRTGEIPVCASTNSNGNSASVRQDVETIRIEPGGRQGMHKSKTLKAIAVMLSLVSALLVTMFVSTSAYGQAVGATLSGTVKDPSGAVVPRAKVLIENTATGVTTAVTTNSSGVYAAPNLLPGPYMVTVVAAGFQTAVQSNITLVVGGQGVSNITLQVGKASQTVHVKGISAAAVQLESPTVSAVVSQRTISTLPLNGRDWTQLATLQPGVSMVHTQASTSSPTVNRGARGYGTQLTDSGHSPYENSYRVDGIIINDYTNSAPGSVAGVTLGVDAIQEFSVETSAYPANYGMASGAVINAISRSGTNQFHGSAYGFLRDEGLDAKNYFDTSGRIPGFHRNQFGIDAGGPIRKNKMFIFGDYEGIRQNQSLTYTDHVPSLAARQGIISGGAPPVSSCPTGTTLITPGQSNTCVNNAVIPYLALWPAKGQNVPGTFGAISGDTQQYTVATGSPYSENYYTARFDANMSAADRFTASFFYDKSPQTLPDALSYVETQSNSIRQMYELSETHTFSVGLVNVARFGFNRAHGILSQGKTALNPAAADPSLGIVTGRNAPILSIPGVTGTSSLGSASFNDFWLNSFQFYDDAFFVHGNHSMQFGFSVDREQYNHATTFNYTGVFSFGSFQSFLQADPNSLTVQSLTLTPKLYARQTAFGAYFTDAWHIRPNLTATLGLRWEPTTLPTNHGIPFETLASLTAPTLTSQSNLWTNNASLHDFEPRVGLAWDPFGTGKTSVRAGFGVYDMLPLPWLYGFAIVGDQAPFLIRSVATNLQPGDFPTVQSTTLGASKVGVNYVPQNPPVAYNLVWNLNVQRAITPSLTATIGYVGSHGVHLPGQPDNANWSLPTYSSAAGGYIWPCAPDTSGTCTSPGGTLLNPNVGGIRPLFSDNSDKYNALEIGVTKSMSQGLEFQGSYTWGKCIDTGSDTYIADPYNNSLGATGDYMYFSHNLTKGLCDYNIGQNFVFSSIWSIPTGHLTRATKYVLGGWQLGGILTAQTGAPFSVFVGGDPLHRNAGDGNSDQPNRLPNCNPITGNVGAYINLSCFTVPTAPAAAASVCNTAGFPGYTGTIPSGQVPCANLFGNAGRNSLVGPKLVDLDFAIYKNIPITAITEAFKVQFQAEFFNSLNHPNFLPPLDNLTLFNQDGSTVGGAGAIDSTSTTSRQIQLALKVIW